MRWPIDSRRVRARSRQAAAATFLLALGLALPVSAPGQNKVLLLDRTEREPRLLRAPASIDASSFDRFQPLIEKRWEAERRVREQLGPHGISRKGLALREKRLERLRKGMAAAQPETLRVLLVRIAFREDRSGTLTSITEDGNFLLEPDPSVAFDPPPHDKAYFESHLVGLEAYWKSMSAGLLEIESQVLPAEPDSAYFLSDIADYGPGSGGNWTIPRLEKLVQDMIRAADEGTQADGTVSLADYDDDDPNTYIIFAHAGGDLQSNLVFTEGDPDYSPNDIPTFFVSLGDSARVDLTSTDSETGQTGQLTEVSVIPESTSQDGLTGSIAAAFYHEFGHALGLPDLYSTLTGLPTVGYWDIMDTGTNLTAFVGVVDEGDTTNVAVTGLLPPQTSAWCKWYLGFADEIRVGGRQQDVRLRPWHRQNPEDKVLRLDVSPNEFFLVTNRWVPFVGEPNWGLRGDPETGVVQYLGDFTDPNNPVNTDMYDFFLPWGGGVMVWRIRQDRIDETIAFNQVQTLPRKLGIELVEADGIKDIGIFDFATVGFVGSETDAFRQFTNGPLPEIPDYPKTATEFGPDTFPPSLSSYGLDTGVHLSDIRPTTPNLTSFDAWVDGYLDYDAGDGFPVVLPPAAAGATTVPRRGDPRSATIFDFAAGRAIVVAAAAADGSEAPGLFAYALDGSPRFAGARIDELGAPLAGPPVAAADFDGTGSGSALVTVDVAGGIHALTDVGPNGGFAEQWTGFPTAFSDSMDTGPLVLPGGAGIVAASLADGRIEVCATDGVLQSSVSGEFTAGLSLRSAPALVRVDDPGGGTREALAYASDRGLELRAPDGTPLVSGEPAWVEMPAGTPVPERGWVVGVPPADGASGSDVLLLVGEAGELVRFHDEDGSWSGQRLGDALGEGPVAAPAVADVDGDGRSELVVATPHWLHARSLSGVSLRGFPIELADRFLEREEREHLFTSAPVVADVDADGLNEILMESNLGLLHGIDSDGGFVDGFPQQRSGGQAVAPLFFDTGDAQSRRVLLLYEALGDTLRPGRRTRDARLAALDLGPSPTTSADARPAEWWGLGGSSARGRRGADGAASENRQLVDATTGAEPMVYPNPVRGTEEVARVRFYSGSAHTATLTVYDLEGQEVTSERLEAQAGEVEEIGWSTRGLASGAYLCRLDYVGSGGRSTDILTLYVER